MTETEQSPELETLPFDLTNYPEGVKVPRVPFPFVDFVGVKTVVIDRQSGKTKVIEELVRFPADAGWCRPAKLDEYLSKSGWRVIGHQNLNPAIPQHLAIIGWFEKFAGHVKGSLKRSARVDGEVARLKAEAEAKKAESEKGKR